MGAASFTTYVDQQYSALQNHSGPLNTCDAKGCTEELDDCPERCEMCRGSFCSGCLKQTECGLMCRACIEKQQPIISSSKLNVARLLSKEYATDEEFRAALVRFGQE